MKKQPRSADQVLREFVARHGSQIAAARALGISQPYMSDIMNGRRDLSERIMKSLGLERVIVERAS